jgi:Tol biopolymer transport system component
MTGFGVAAVVVALALVGASVTAALQPPEVQYLRGYPSAARLEAERPARGFVPLAARFVSKVLGVDAPDAQRPTASGSKAVGRASGPPPRIQVNHPFTNDAFSDAYAVQRVPFLAQTTTRTATREPGEPTCGGGIGGSAWYRYAPPADSGLRASTFGSNYALSLGVYSGSSLSSLTAEGCDTSPTGSAEVTIQARHGRVYFFQITGTASGDHLIFTLEPLGKTQRVSVSSSGAEADGVSYSPAMSADGRYVAFSSSAGDLAPGGALCTPAQRHTYLGLVGGNCLQVFVHDRRTGATTLESVSSDGTPADGLSGGVSISGDGRFVAFQTLASNFAGPACTTSTCRFQVYLRDRLTATTELISGSTRGVPGNGSSGGVSISADGRYVAFQSDAPDLGPCATGCATPQIYVRDRVTRTTRLASVGSDGVPANGGSVNPAISADGQSVAFQSAATNLARTDTNGFDDIFVHDFDTARTEAVSVSGTGAPANGVSQANIAGALHYVSRDGRYVAFRSAASNLVPNDTNGQDDFFVRDRVARTTTRVSVSSLGAEAHPAGGPRGSTGGSVAISDDGRFVGFDTNAPDLIDPKGTGSDSLRVYVRDTVLGLTTKASVSTNGEDGDYLNFGPSFSADGALVAFWSTSSNLVEDDSNVCVNPYNTLLNCADIFVHEVWF